MGPARGHLATVVLLLLTISAAMAQEETEDELEFSYVPGAKNGPSNWGFIKPEWATCATGKMQSPIDLSHKHVTLVSSLGYLNYSYRPADATIVNRGHDIMVRFNADAGSLTINGTAYYLKQLHWHSPSEHAIDGRRYDLELHLVHESAKNKAAVIAVLYKVVAGGHDPFLRTLEKDIKRIADRKNMEEHVGVVDPSLARPKGSVYYRYMGSLTTPPCKEGVVWTVFKMVSPVAKYQRELLRDAVHDGMEDNARPLQKVNDRVISIFCPKPHIPAAAYCHL